MDRYQRAVNILELYPEFGEMYFSGDTDYFHVIIKEICGPSEVEIKWPRSPLTFLLVQVSGMLSDLWVKSVSQVSLFGSVLLCPFTPQPADLGGAQRGCGREIGSVGGQDVV